MGVPKVRTQNISYRKGGTARRILILGRTTPSPVLGFYQLKASGGGGRTRSGGNGLL